MKTLIVSYRIKIKGTEEALIASMFHNEIRIKYKYEERQDQSVLDWSFINRDSLVTKNGITTGQVLVLLNPYVTVADFETQYKGSYWSALAENDSNYRLLELVSIKKPEEIEIGQPSDYREKSFNIHSREWN